MVFGDSGLRSSCRLTSLAKVGMLRSGFFQDLRKSSSGSTQIMSQLCGTMTIVSGLPRSGTSLMMQMLAAGGLELLTDNLRVADQDNPNGYFEFEPVKETRHDAEWMTLAHGKAVKVIYKLLPELLREYSYRVIFMRRDLDEVVASQQQMLERRGEPGAGLPTEAMHRVFQGELDRTLMWLNEQPNFKVFCVDYLQAIEKPDEVSQQVFRFLEIPLDAKAMAARVQPELYRQRKG